MLIILSIQITSILFNSSLKAHDYTILSLEIWGKAQLEAAKRRKSHWKYNLEGCRACKNLRDSIP